MYNFIKTIRLAAIFSFVLGIIYLFAKFLLIPILIFALIMKLFGYFKFSPVKKSNNQESNKKHDDDNFIDAEYEDVD